MGHSSAGLANNCTCYYHVIIMLLSCYYHVIQYVLSTGHFIWHRLVWNLATIPTLAMSCPVHLLSQIYSDLGEIGSHIGLVALRISVLFWQNPAPIFSSHCTLHVFVEHAFDHGGTQLKPPCSHPI